MNVYDSKRIVDLLAATKQITTTEDPNNADILLLNTCSIREKAAEKVFSELGRFRKLKDKRPHVIIGVAGCVASQEGVNIQRRAPYVDIIVGPQTIHRLPELINKLHKHNKPQIDIAFPEIEKFDKLPEPKADGPCAFVSIMEGCNKFCSYCIVPYTRGKEISRPFNDVIVECYQLAQAGVREITLLGQNVNAYTGTMPDGNTVNLANLLLHLAEIPEIERLRFTTSHPVEFDDSLIYAYRDIPKLATQLHLPVQSGSDAILAKMKRTHTILEYKAIIKKLRSIRPNISISSDFIVGFPGETDSDFQKTMQLVTEIGFDQSFSFIYSPRPGTPATNYPDNVSLETKKSRLQELQQLLTKQANTISQNMVGTTQTILLNGKSKNSGTLSGRTENNRIVHIKADESMLGQMLNVKITEALPNCLRGEIL